MKYLSEFRDPEQARQLAAAIAALLPRVRERLPQLGERPLRFMEVCGGHTHAIFRYGLNELLPAGIEFIHGPGCPVCVLPMARVDDCVALVQREGVILTSYGDAMRVPGSRRSLLQARAEGGDVRVVYSPMDALALARDNPQRQVVFFALGFETTMPSTALTVLQAAREGIDNFSVYCNHITIIATLRAILQSPEMSLDGFIGPGHVSMVIGEAPYRFVAERFGKPMVIAGFEPLDVLQSVWLLLRQLASGRCEIENQYLRVVRAGGNAAALAAIGEVFELREFFEWRGLGSIDHSGVRLKPAYARFDAERRYALNSPAIADPRACQCGEVLKGVIKPPQCKLFGGRCTPASPVGALMVSSEGACAAYYRYRHSGAEPVTVIDKPGSEEKVNRETAESHP